MAPSRCVSKSTPRPSAPGTFSRDAAASASGLTVRAARRYASQGSARARRSPFGLADDARKHPHSALGRFSFALCERSRARLLRQPARRAPRRTRRTRSASAAGPAPIVVPHELPRALLARSCSRPGCSTRAACSRSPIGRAARLGGGHRRAGRRTIGPARAPRRTATATATSWTRASASCCSSISRRRTS